MSNAAKPLSWVVYRMTVRGKPTGSNAVCEQAEWEAMEISHPGYHTLVMAGIGNEGEAERLARVGAVDGNVSKQSPEQAGLVRQRDCPVLSPPQDTEAWQKRTFHDTE